VLPARADFEQRASRESAAKIQSTVYGEMLRRCGEMFLTAWTSLPWVTRQPKGEGGDPG
jgi:hypothetical protein